ncbi:Cyclic nucleotide-binding-like [Phytophthora cactorum]|nr:Cyclic nucleotide-binding-like [Phytophthora cactorum]
MEYEIPEGGMVIKHNYPKKPPTSWDPKTSIIGDDIYDPIRTPCVGVWTQFSALTASIEAAATVSSTWLWRTRCSKGDRRSLTTGSGSGYTCWAIEDYLVGTNVGRQYGRAVYWASRSVVTAGFYDVAATTNIETVYAIFAQVVGAIFSTAVLATFLFIFRYRNARMQEFMAHVDSAKEYMQVRHFPENVREGVLGYYKNTWATHHALHHDEVIERLPGHLKVSLYSVLKAKRIQDVAFLSKESIEFINTLALRVEYCVYSPKDWIIEKLPDGMYFVLRGSVQLDGPRHPQVAFAKAGDHFAEGSLLFPSRSDERARAQTYCDLYKLPQRCFNKTLTVFYRENAPQHLEDMRSMHARHDQQEQKMKKMLGRSADNAEASANPSNSGGRYSVTYGNDVRGVRPRQRIPWRMPGSSFRKYWEHARLFSLVFVVFEVPLYCVFDADTFPFGTKSIYSLQSMTSILVEAFFVVDFVFRARFFAYVDQLALITPHSRTFFKNAASRTMLLVLEAEFEPILEEFTRDRCLRDAGLHGNCSWTLYDAYGQIGTTFKIQDPEHSIYTVKMAYMRSIYWAIVALTTVGYGDIVAFSTYESYFAALWVFVGGIINYGVVGAMSNIISNLTASSRHHSEKMNTVNVTLGHFRISRVFECGFDSSITSNLFFTLSLYERFRSLSMRRTNGCCMNSRDYFDANYSNEETLFLRKEHFVKKSSVVDASVITYSAFVAKIESHFPAEMESLRLQATQQHIFDTLTLEAVIDNIKSRSTLAKFTEKCTSMFEEKENWGQQRNKMRLRLYWDLIVLALDVYNSFQVTFRIGFLAHPSSGTRLFLVISDFVGDALLIADIYLKLYYFECEEVGLMNLISREERSMTYTGHELRNDMLSSLPLYYVGSSFLAMSLCRLPRLLRLHQIPGMIDSLIMRLQQRFSAGGNISAYLSPIKLVLILLFTGHLAACVFYLICHTDHNHKNWTHHDPIVVMEHESVGVLYLRAFYWALTTLTLINGLAMRLKSELYIPGDTIIVEGDLGHKLYIVKGGMGMVLWKSTVEIVKDIKSGDSGASKKPKNIEELRELNAMKAQDDEDNAPVVDPLRYVSASALEERKIMCFQADGKRQNSDECTRISRQKMVVQKLPSHLSGRRLFAWHTPRNATAGLSKMKSFKNGTAVQINPVSRSMREYYRDEQLVEMEEECWRRYKVSLFMADAFTGEVIKQSPAVTPASPQLLMQPQQIQTNAAPISQNTSRNDEDNAPTASKAAKKIRVSRKTFCGAMLPGASPQRATRSLVTTDGMRFLANYESRNRPSERGLRQKRRPRGSIHGHELHQSFGIANLPSGAARAHRRQRKLKRSQSLPLFDRHFAHMIRDELQDSNAKEFESKLNLGFELLQRCRQPEFSSLFRVYLSWLKHKRRWRQWYEHQTERFTWLNSFSSTHSDSEKPAISRTNSFFHDSGHDRTTSSTSLRDGASSSTSSKAEDFVNLLSRCYRLWEWVVVFVGLFYAVTIPFFVCFASDLKTFHEDHEDEVALAHWERIVIGIDLVCMADLFLKHSAFRRVLVLSDGGSTDVPTATQQPVAPPPLTSMSSTRTLTLPTAPQQSSHKRKNWWQQYVNTHLWLDVVTSLPFDILLYVPPLSTSTMADHRWFYLSLFQLNKVPRIVESIEASERLTQFLAADLNLPIGESRLHFIRTVCVYVLSGHWIGCLWFRLGLHAYDIYGDSWLSTYKMLAVDEFEELSEIPTSRRYLRSLHFAIGSITTVFYGDVVSMNAVETVVEIAFIVGVRGLSTLLVEDIAQYTLRGFANRVSILKSCDEASCALYDVFKTHYLLVIGSGLGDVERLLADYPEYREQNRREWVIVSTVLKTGESRFRSIIDIVARMEKANWVLVDEIIRKAKSLK